MNSQRSEVKEVRRVFEKQDMKQGKLASRL